MDKTFIEYQQQIDSCLTENVLRETIQELRPLRLFIKDDLGEWLPLRHAGFTLITPIFEDEVENIKAYVRLSDLQQMIIQKLDPALYVPAPVSAFHQTIARLVSGSDFDNQIRGAREELFIKLMKQELAQLPQFEKIQMEIRGITVLPGGFIAALVIADNEDEYQRLLLLRSKLYTNKELQNFGVEPKRPFIGHITLAYIQAPLDLDNQKNLIKTIQTINQDFLATPIAFEVVRAEVRKFENYLRFFRELDWPVYRFG
jgi:hypothetical protein